MHILYTPYTHSGSDIAVVQRQVAQLWQ